MTETPATQPQPTGDLPYRGRHAPEQAVWIVTALAAQPNPGPTGGPTVEQWRAQIRLLVDTIWREAWTAGAAYAASTQPTRIVIQANNWPEALGGGS